MFEKFPKYRRPLPEEYESIYLKHLKLNRSGCTVATSLSQKMESWLHKQVAKDVINNPKSFKTLEIGAGTLNQLLYEEHKGEYDIVEPEKDYYSDSPLLSKINKIYMDVNEIPDSNCYDRITSIATFEHISNLPQVVAKTGILLNPEGKLRVSIPSEGTILWYLGWKLTTGLEFKLKYGLDYKVLRKYEHVNLAREIDEILKYFYKKVEKKVFGLSSFFSFYQFYNCIEPKIELCKGYLNSCSQY